MAVVLTLLSSQPTRTSFALDQLTLVYKSDSSWDVTVVDPGVPKKGDAHSTFPFMFVSDIRLQESAISACTFDVIYLGAFDSSGGNPIVPGTKIEQNVAVLSASSSKASNGTVLTSPATVQYYAPTSIKTYFSYNAAATGNFVADPTADIVPISLIVGDTGLSITEPIQNVIHNFFQEHIIHTIESSQFSQDGKYWVNSSRKQKLLQSWLFAVTAGAYVSLYNPGINYNVGDSVTVTAGGGSATMSITSVGSIWGTSRGIMSFTVSSNTFTSSHTGLSATGGSGTGAGFNVTYIP